MEYLWSGFVLIFGVVALLEIAVLNSRLKDEVRGEIRQIRQEVRQALATSDTEVRLKAAEAMHREMAKWPTASTVIKAALEGQEIHWPALEKVPERPALAERPALPERAEPRPEKRKPEKSKKCYLCCQPSSVLVKSVGWNPGFKMCPECAEEFDPWYRAMKARLGGQSIEIFEGLFKDGYG